MLKVFNRRNLSFLLLILFVSTSLLTACEGGAQINLDVTEGEDGVNITGGIAEGGEEAVTNNTLLFIILIVVFMGLITIIVSSGNRSS